MTNQSLKRAPTPEELERLISAFSTTSVSGARNRALMALMWRMGLEVADVIALKLGDLGAPDGLMLAGEITKPGARRLVIHPKVGDAIRTWLTELFRMKFPGRLSAATPLFPTLEKNKFGRHLSPSYVRAMVLRAAGHEGIKEDFGVQSLRDGLALELRSLGYDLRAIQLFLGDQTRSRTLRYGDTPLDGHEGADLKDPAWRHPDPLAFSIIQGCEELRVAGRAVGHDIGLRTVLAFTDGHYEVSSGGVERMGINDYRENLSLDDVVSGLWSQQSG